MAYFFNPFAGEIGRLFWWGAQILIMVIIFALLFATVILVADPEAPIETRNGGELTSLLGIGLLGIYLNLCTSVNRLRDAGRSGWWYLAFNIPFIGSALMIFMCGILPGSRPSLSGIFDDGPAFDPDDIINRYKSGQSAANHYAPPSPSPQPSVTPSSINQSSQGFGKRRGFQGNWS